MPNNEEPIVVEVAEFREPPPAPPPIEEPDVATLGYDPTGKPPGWIALKEATLARAAERAAGVKPTIIEPAYPTEVKPDSPGGQVATIKGKEVYIPGSTMYEMGFRTEQESLDAQSRGVAFGPHPGSKVPKDSAIVPDTISGRKTALRVTPHDVGIHGAVSPHLLTKRRRAQQWAASIIKGKQVLKPARTIERMALLKGKPQFEAMVAAGIIEKGAEFVPGVGEKWSYISAAEVAKREAFIKAHIELADGKWVLIKDWNKIPAEYQTIGLRQGFTAMKKAMEKAKIKPPKTPVRIPKLPPTPPTARERMIERVRAGDILIHKPPTKAEIDRAREVWQNVSEYLKNQFISPDIPSQANLAQKYKEEQALPLWSRLLFGTTIVKDPKTNKYSQIVLGEPPLVSPAGSGAKVAKVSLKTIEINWNKLLSPRVIKPQINWNKLTKAIEAGKIRSADEAVRWAKQWEVSQAARLVKPVSLTPAQIAKQKALTEEGMRIASEAATRARAANAIRIGKVALIPQPKVPITQWQPFKPSQLTVTRMKGLIASWQAMKPSEAIRIMAAANLITFAVATNAKAIASIISMTSSSTQARVLSALSPDIKQALQTQQLAKAQTLAQMKTQTALQLQTLTRLATELAEKLVTQGKTATQIKEAVQAKLQLQTRTITNTLVRQQVKPAISTITRTVISMPSPIKPLIKPPIIKPVSVKPILLPRGASDKEKRKIIKAADGAIAWRHGELHGKDVWHVGLYPYESKENWGTVLGKKPAGATIVKGPGSARQTIKLLYGKAPPRKITGDVGFFDWRIKPVGVSKVDIEFTPDPKMETTGDITLGRRAPPITERRLALTGRGKSPRITPKIPALRR